MTGQRVLPGLGLSAYWTKGTGNWDVQHDPDTRKLSALVQCHAKSRTALPGSPVDGDIYIVPSAAGTNPNQIVIRDNGAWVYYAPQEGWLVWVDDEDNFVVWSGTAWTPFRPGTVLPDIAGKAGKVLKVNAGATGLTWADDLQGSGGGGEGPVDDPKFSPHIYWRFVATAATTGNPFVRIGNLEFRGADGTDLTGANGVAFADVGNAANAFDGSDSSYWDSAALSNGPHYVGWQFDDATKINSFLVRMNSSEGNSLAGFRIDFSDDGVEYTTAYEYAGAPIAPDTTFGAGWYADTVPEGGTAGQILAKRSGDDFDTYWIDAPSGGGSEPGFGKHLYWRVVPTANTGDNDYIHIAEVVFADEPGGLQLATGGTPIASGNYADRFPAKAFDGVPSTIWESQSGSVSGGTVWIGYQFASPVDIHQVRLTNLLSYENDEWITAGKVQFSDNGTAWSDAWSFVLAPWVGSTGNQTQISTDPALSKLRTFTGSTDTAQLSDANKLIVGNGAAAQTATIPANATAAFEIGDVLTWMQRGAGLLTISPAGGVTLDVPEGFSTVMRHRYGSISATKVDTNEWIITGALASV
ncbi:MAG: hypothetical protein DI533_20250 [Cereibacter sphaeroides]|uniref:F5/8 type C domain-containing protein n=1 Tax=Cereibacter sphaeroides TaxID=1063 RepID=A0A2W5S7Z2_CERSP|nr:MAG: hypothetical protein DI533_20250 [Cereibacter sphaeroides]